jgi:hypothetical protein
MEVETTSSSSGWLLTESTLVSSPGVWESWALVSESLGASVVSSPESGSVLSSGLTHEAAGEKGPQAHRRELDLQQPGRPLFTRPPPLRLAACGRLIGVVLESGLVRIQRWRGGAGVSVEVEFAADTLQLGNHVRDG